MRRWRERYEEFGYDGLFDRRRGKPSPKRVALVVVEQVLGLYRDRYPDWHNISIPLKCMVRRRAARGLKLTKGQSA